MFHIKDLPKPIGVAFEGQVAPELIGRSYKSFSPDELYDTYKYRIRNGLCAPAATSKSIHVDPVATNTPSDDHGLLSLTTVKFRTISSAASITA